MSRILVVTPRVPTDRNAWSGISHHLLAALRDVGTLAGAVDGHVGVARLAELAGTFSFNDPRWQQRRTSMQSRMFAMTRPLTDRIISRRVRRSATGADAIMQFGGRLHLSVCPHAPLRASYQDGNLATFFARPDLALPRDTTLAKRTLDRERRIYDDLDLIMCFSDWLRASFIESFEQDPGKVVTVGAGANLPDPGQLPVRNASPPRFLFIGKHFERKGGPLVVEAFHHVRAQHPDAELWIVSDHTAADGEGVTYHGRIPNDVGREATLDRLYRDATAFVMPSHYEPFGLVFVEAMAYGLPCVGVASHAMPEIIEHGATGYLGQVGDATTLATHMRSLADDPDHASAMGAAGRRRYLDRFTWAAVAQRMIEQIDRRIS